jgi:plastocyanin domain-containing protein
LFSWLPFRRVLAAQRQALSVRREAADKTTKAASIKQDVTATTPTTPAPKLSLTTSDQSVKLTMSTMTSKKEVDGTQTSTQEAKASAKAWIEAWKSKQGNA